MATRKLSILLALTVSLLFGTGDGLSQSPAPFTLFPFGTITSPLGRTPFTRALPTDNGLGFLGSRNRPSPFVPSSPLPLSALSRDSITSSQWALASVPDMYGDFFGGRPARNGQRGLPPRGGAGTRQVKLSENVSAQPRTRLFLSYHFFNDVLDGSIGDVNRYTLGYELANRNQTASIDVRLPFANTISNVQINDEPIAKNEEIGNLHISTKAVLASGQDWLVSAGLGLALPTGADQSLLRPGDQLEILHVHNDSVHLIPYLAYLKLHSDRIFTQGFVQIDVDANGNRVRGDTNAFNLRPLGVVQDPTILFLDFGIGYKLAEFPNARRLDTISLGLELHYATTLQDTDQLIGSSFNVGDTTRRFDILNTTFGSTIVIGKTAFRPGIVVPLRDGDDRQFDFEVFFQANRYF